MLNHFEMNRCSFSQLIEKIAAMESINEVLVDKETSIEIYGGNKIAKDKLIEILREFNILDNLFQDECKKQYEESNLSIGYYQFEPQWIRVSDSDVVVGYCGIIVNSNIDKVFVKVDGMWKMN